MSNYEYMKAELLNIAKIVNQFPENIGSKVYDLLISEFVNQQEAPSVSPATASRNNLAKIKAKPANKKAPKKTARKSKESYSIDGELNLRGDKSIPSFKDFCQGKNPASATDFNVVATYYLQKMMGRQEVELGHVYTCYKDVGRKPPSAFRQSFHDAKNRHGHIDFGGEGGLLKVTHRGAVYVEHDLPKSTKHEK
ncbi:MAG: hypothetical protein OXU31_04395 [Gammaproteobacteria bacterium]|nr:hypothetical protein [Gammaproteobacteria bacterium]